jgi:hypothetical protein
MENGRYEQLGSTISGSDSQRFAVFLEMCSRLAASRTDTFSRKTMRLSLLRVPTLITPATSA